MHSKECATFWDNRNRKLEISTVPTKAKSWEPTYSESESE